MSFAELNLNNNIFRAIDACGYKIPTPIQMQSIPDILEGNDLVASAQTGTGKTAAFVLPALHRLTLAKSTSKPRVLILTPTRELAAQITQSAAKYGKFLQFNIVSLVGGMPYRQQLRSLAQRHVDIIVATPGRLLDHMDNKKLDLSGVEMLILDEADRMLDMGFIDDVQDIAKATPNNRQTLLFSATVDKKLSNIIRQLLKEPKRIDLSEEVMAPALIKQEIYLADNIQHKNRLLQHFLEHGNIFKGIIFSATKINADQLAKQLSNQGFEAAALHGDLKQSQRNKTIEQLRRGKIQFLIATDVAARGIDINDITHVINFDLPKFSEDYVHRIGRTGRAGKEGTAISLVLPADARHLQKIERYIGEKLSFSVIEGLEPTKRLAKSDTNTSGAKRSFGKSSGGFKRKEPRASYARSDSHKSDYRNDDDSRGHKRARPNDRKSFSERGERSFSNEHRAEFKKDENRGPKRVRQDERRPSLNREERSFSNERRSEFKKDENRGQKRVRQDERRPSLNREERSFSNERRSEFKKDENQGQRRARPDDRKLSLNREEKRFSSEPRESSVRKSFRADAPKTDSRDFSKRRKVRDINAQSENAPRRKFRSDERTSERSTSENAGRSRRGSSEPRSEKRSFRDDSRAPKAKSWRKEPRQYS